MNHPFIHPVVPLMDRQKPPPSLQLPPSAVHIAHRAHRTRLAKTSGGSLEVASLRATGSAPTASGLSLVAGLIVFGRGRVASGSRGLER